MQASGLKEAYASWQRKFFRPDRWGRRLVVGLLFSFILAIFLHHREVLVENLELHTKTEKYVLAQVGFEFSDYAATSLVKQESLRDVGKIFRLNGDQVALRAAEIENAIVSDDKWRTALPLATFGKMYNAKNIITECLLKTRFVDARTLQKMQEVGFSTEGYHIYVPSTENFITFPQQLWYEMVTQQGPEIDFVLKIYQNVGPWEIKEDLAVQNAVRQAVKASIPPAMTRVEPGTRIIDAGEKVTPRHLEMMKAMKRALSEKKTQLTLMSVSGSLMMALLFTLMGVVFLKVQHPAILRSFRKITLLATIIVLTLFVAKSTEFVLINKSGHLAELCRYPIFVLFGTLLISLLIGRDIALITSVFLSVVLGLTLAINYNHFLVINIIGALVAIINCRRVRKRKEIFEVCGKVWLALIPVIVAFNLFEGSFWNITFLADLFTTLLFLGGIALLVVGLLPVLESAFDIVTDMTLMEYTDPNHPLLRRMDNDAAGTFQHSLIVGVIAEAGAQAIGANGLFCRVAAAFHDIGKLVNPHYFIENQQNEINLHNLLTPLESAQVIIAHVTDGVALAQQHKLPQSFVDVIREHHGTSLVYCFYMAQLELKDNAIEEGAFRYRGPKPHTKESAILMIADTVEAAFRSTDQADEKKTIDLVDKLVAEKISDGQLDDCQLTFEELKKIKQAMVRVLLNTRHTRVKYPVKKGAYVTRIEELFVQRI